MGGEQVKSSVPLDGNPNFPTPTLTLTLALLTLTRAFFIFFIILVDRQDNSFDIHSLSNAGPGWVFRHP